MFKRRTCMSTRTELLKLLDENFGSFVSGEKIGRELGISRAAINKAATSLRKTGYRILSRPSQGYRLMEKADLLTEESIGSHVKFPCRFKIFDTIDSTNSYAKTIDVDDEPIAIIANAQTAGRGRLGRKFASPGGTGVYISVAFRPRFELDKSAFITMATAIAVCHAIDEVCGVNPKIKWVNDIFYKGLKVCGILTEAQTNLETGRIDSLITGIGINCFPGIFPPELDGIAGSISTDADSFSRSALAGTVINNVLKMLSLFPDTSFLKEYRRRCFIIGKNVTVNPISGGRSVSARVLGVEDNGGLVVEYMEGIRMREIDTLTTGEVSIKE